MKSFGWVTAAPRRTRSRSCRTPFVLDRVYIYGDPLVGQKRAIALNARDVTITNSTVRDIKTVGQDTQAIGGWNGPGPY